MLARGRSPCPRQSRHCESGLLEQMSPPLAVMKLKRPPAVKAIVAQNRLHFPLLFAYKLEWTVMEFIHLIEKWGKSNRLPPVFKLLIIGRASCRERVKIKVVAEKVKKKKRQND